MSAVTLTTITSLVRSILQDFSQSQIDVFEYSTSSVFTLSEPNIISVTAVLIDDTELASGDYSFDSTTLKLTISAAMTSGDPVEVRYTAYKNYSDSELEHYIRSAVVYLSTLNYYSFELAADDTIYPEPESNEENLIALIASILAEPDNVSFSVSGFSVRNPESLPTRDLISKVVAGFKSGGFHGVLDVL
jgi:hypothetical protein